MRYGLASGTPPGLRPGHAFKGMIWELGRAVCLPAEKERYEETKSRHHGGGPASAVRLRMQRRQKTGKAGYRGRTEKIERPGDGQTAVLAEHSTDGQCGTAPAFSVSSFTGQNPSGDSG